MRVIVQDLTNPGDTICDPFAGSGTTGCAAVIENRNFVGVECDENYYQIAERRIAQAQMQLPLLEAV